MPLSKMDFECLPPEVLVIILRGIHIRDLLNLRSTNTYLRDLIDNHSSLWTYVSFRDSWPCSQNLVHFSKAAEAGNREALIKKGIAFLYNEGFDGPFVSDTRIQANGTKAAEAFIALESLQMTDEPFTWLFIRPPWSSTAPCCKKAVMQSLCQYVKESKSPSPFVRLCIFKTMDLHEPEDQESKLMDDHLNKAIAKRVVVADYYKWLKEYGSRMKTDAGSKIASVRYLRTIANRGCWQAQVQLYKCYLRGDYGLYDKLRAYDAIRQWIQASTCKGIHNVYSDKEFSHSMRYILIDWIVEVAHLKKFDSHTLHLTINLLDRFLQRRRPCRSNLQLVGVACLVLASRFMCQDIISIREAAWLTDATYKYEDVVRMMGEITATLGGQFRVPMTLDYVEVIGIAANNSHKAQCFAEYLCEVVELHSDLTLYPRALIASACVLIAKLHVELDEEDPDNKVWSTKLETVTGYSTSDIKPCAFAVHEKCFSKAIYDHRNVELKAVKSRYHEDNFCNVADIEIISSQELHQFFARDYPATPYNSDDEDDLPDEADASCLDLIASPSRSRHGSLPVRFRPDRESAGTPMCLSPSEEVVQSWPRSSAAQNVPLLFSSTPNCSSSVACSNRDTSSSSSVPNRTPLIDILNQTRNKRKSSDTVGNQLKTRVKAPSSYSQ